MAVLNRPPVKGLEFPLASVVAAVVPAAIRAAVIGSVISAIAAAAMTLIDAMRYWQWSFGFVAETAVAMLSTSAFSLFVGALIGIAFCGFYLFAVGLPVAWLLRERLETSRGFIAMLVTAPVSAYIASEMIGIGPMNWATHEDGWSFALACAYAVPAAFFFHRDIIIAREMSPWAED